MTSHRWKNTKAMVFSYFGTLLTNFPLTKGKDLEVGRLSWITQVGLT